MGSSKKNWHERVESIRETREAGRYSYLKSHFLVSVYVRWCDKKGKLKHPRMGQAEETFSLGRGGPAELHV